jgi:DNA adenine methylase
MTPRQRGTLANGHASSAVRITLEDDPPVLPFLKWPGGKRWAAEQIASIVDRHLTRRYYEPFLGGGAVFFHLRPARATLSDINGELVAGYQAIRDRHVDVVRFLQMLPVTKRVYAEVRNWKPRGSAEQAARLLYLNRTAFGGMYRLNQRGEFNVPYGSGERTPEILWQTTVLADASAALARARLRTCDFARSMQYAGEGDVVYCDPTYTVAHDNNGFVRYNERNFSWADQQRLARAATAARNRGAVVIVSNAYHDSIRALYQDARQKTLHRLSRISAEPANRRPVSEYLLVLKP